MMELDLSEAEAVAGGVTVLQAFGLIGSAYSLASNMIEGIRAGGATLRNYYGSETTLDIFAAGNMGA